MPVSGTDCKKLGPIWAEGGHETPTGCNDKTGPSQFIIRPRRKLHLWLQFNLANKGRVLDKKQLGQLLI
jgi:hypothetical protein